MIEQAKKWVEIAIFLLAMAACIFWKHTEMVQKIHTDQMIDAWGDGLKTYTNAMYHIDHDSTYHWFEGMNYPYGEHIVPATELPGIAMLMKAFKGAFPNISDYVVQVIHTEMLLALLLSGLFIFLIFRQLKLPFWYSLPLAIGMAFLAPQNLRMTSHYGLAQQFVIPCLLYLLLLYHQKPSWKLSFFIALSIFIASFLHFYFFAITVFFVSGYLFFRGLIDFQHIPWKQLLPHYFLMTFVPLIFFWFWMLGADPVTDRSPHPFGFFHYHAIWESVFLNIELPYYQWINDNVIKIERIKSFEGVAYIGLPAALFFVIITLRGLWHKFKPPLFPFLYQHQRFFTAIFLAAFTLLLFSFAFPFTIKGWEWIADGLGPIRQFRSLGRFAWIFFYVINVLAFTGIYVYFQRQKNAVWKWSFLLFIVAVFSYEVWHFNQKITLRLSTVEYFNRGAPFTAIDSIDFSKYQAILPIPYFNVGSNNFPAGVQGFISQKSYTLSLQTGLPNMGAMLTRSSRQQAFNQWQLILSAYRPPAIFADLKKDKPLLLLWQKNQQPHDLQKYQHLLEGAKLLYEKDNLELFETSAQDFLTRIKEKQASIEAALKGDLFPHQHLMSTDSVLNFIYHDFEDAPAEQAYLGKGSFAGIQSQRNQLLKAKLPYPQKDSLYHFQAWIWIDSDRFTETFFEIDEISSNNERLQSVRFHVWPKVRTLDPKGWALVDVPFHLKSTDSHLDIHFRHPTVPEQDIWVDEVLIKKTSTHLYQKGDDWVWEDGLYFEGFVE